MRHRVIQQLTKIKGLKLRFEYSFVCSVPKSVKLCLLRYAAAKEECEAVFGIPAFAQCSFDTASYISRYWPPFIHLCYCEDLKTTTFNVSLSNSCSFRYIHLLSSPCSCIYDTCAVLAIERTDNFSPACITALAYAKACENQRETLHSNDQYDDLAGKSWV